MDIPFLTVLPIRSGGKQITACLPWNVLQKAVCVFLFQLRFTVQSVLEAIDRMVTASYIGMVLLLSPAVSEID